MKPKLLDGYPRFAAFITEDRDAAIYRKFERLSARNLLYQQSEIHDLEGQLEDLDKEDADDLEDEGGSKSARLWTHFAHDQGDKSNARRMLNQNIKIKLKEYRTGNENLLCQQKSTADLSVRRSAIA